jgi:hypothetical protein
MNRDNVGEVIATRRLYYLDESNQKRTVTVYVGKPLIAPDASEYQCPFQLIGLGNEQIQLARGHDSVQALQSALILVAASLNHLNDRLGPKLVWDGGAKGELRFP